MAKPMTVAKQSRRVAQVRAGQTTIEGSARVIEVRGTPDRQYLTVAFAEPAPASPLEQLAQIDALMASPTPEGYSRIVRESGWAEIVKSRLVELEEKSRVLGHRIVHGMRAMDEREREERLIPQPWIDKLRALEDEQADVDEAHRNLLWQYERQMGRSV